MNEPAAHSTVQCDPTNAAKGLCQWCHKRPATGWDNWWRFKICEECSKRTDVYDGEPVDYSPFPVVAVADLVRGRGSR